MAGGQDKAVAVGPSRVLGVEAQGLGEQHGCDVGHAHGHARVPRIGLLNRVHGEGADRVGHLLLADGCRFRACCLAHVLLGPSREMNWGHM